MGFVSGFLDETFYQTGQESIDPHTLSRITAILLHLHNIVDISHLKRLHIITLMVETLIPDAFTKLGRTKPFCGKAAFGLALRTSSTCALKAAAATGICRRNVWRIMKSVSR
jgi:hypothetical protein